MASWFSLAVFNPEARGYFARNAALFGESGRRLRASTSSPIELEALNLLRGDAVERLHALREVIGGEAFRSLAGPRRPVGRPKSVQAELFLDPFSGRASPLGGVGFQWRCAGGEGGGADILKFPLGRLVQAAARSETPLNRLRLLVREDPGLVLELDRVLLMEGFALLLCKGLRLRFVQEVIAQLDYERLIEIASTDEALAPDAVSALMVQLRNASTPDFYRDPETRAIEEPLRARGKELSLQALLSDVQTRPKKVSALWVLAGVFEHPVARQHLRRLNVVEYERQADSGVAEAFGALQDAASYRNREAFLALARLAQRHPRAVISLDWLIDGSWVKQPLWLRMILWPFIKLPSPERTAGNPIRVLRNLDPTGLHTLRGLEVSRALTILRLWGNRKA